ncbi:MAG: hypothetical protein ACI9OD_000799 [Limisphaerales bacterium]|jgi:hypothetical protein
MTNLWYMLARTAILVAGLLAPFPNSATAQSAGLELFEKQIRPLLVEHCYECHSQTSKNLKGGLRLDSRLGWERGGDSGRVIVPGRPEESRLIRAVRYHDQDFQMPPRNRLSAGQISALEQWVKLGAPDPRSDDLPEIAQATGMTIEEGRQFWAFKPVIDSVIPDLGNARSVASPIDSFIGARLSKVGLAPAPRSDRRTLIRRATYDLIGLPPTSAEVQGFLDDSSTNAFGKVIERLLASKHYGVRWGRHWLDVARYADSNGLDENLAFGNAWRYRDYVIDSFNDDKPFDRFVIEQLAGDLLPTANQETKTATGFLALGAKVLAEKDLDKLMMDIVDEQIDTVGKAFLGMTLGCARCHDHKFDPISQRDYYGLAAIFKSTHTITKITGSTIKYWYEHSFASETELKELAEIDKQLAAKKRAASSYLTAATLKARGEARLKAAEYLIASALFESSASLAKVKRIAKPFGLHPRILHHCRLHLEYHRNDSFFGSWHTFTGDTNAIARYYRPLFKQATKAFKIAMKKDPKNKILDDPRLEPARAALYDLSGFLAVPPNPEFAFDPETLAELGELQQAARLLESGAPDKSAAMGVCDGEILESLPIHIRGDHNNLGEPVKREFPSVLRWSSSRPILPDGQSGRLQLAEWIADSRNPLTARVFVNRVWRWHFGRGLAGTTENFGVRGDRPEHPELLDWLAYQFMRAGWSVKELHRLIMNSSVYQMASIHPAAQAAADIDPGNQLWWHFENQRLEAEQIRDSILAVSGLLDDSMGGKTIPLRNKQFVFNHTSKDHTGYERRLRRAAYLPVVRNHLCEIFQQFDYPDPSTPTGNRNTTTVAPQALLLMNSSLVMNAAAALAEQVLELEADDDAARIEAAYQRVFARNSTKGERDRSLHFISESSGQLSFTDAVTVDKAANDAARKKAWSLFCQSLLASNEFIYLN